MRCARRERNIVNEKPAFIQGLHPYEGCGLERPISFEPRVTYLVPGDRRAQTVYFRAGNASPEMIYLVLTRRGDPMRYFPVGAKSAIHVPLAVLEDISPETLIEILVAAPAGLKSSVLLDIGFMEIL
jgi:hypothetical protein